MFKKLILFILTSISISTQAQNIFVYKLDRCKTDKFCLDCGDVKASCDQVAFEELIKKLNSSLKLNGLSGSVKFQVLVDSTGMGCVLSHTDESNNPVTQQITRQLNKFNKWIPAVTANWPEQRTSINVVFSIVETRVFSKRINKIEGKIERVDIEAFKKSFDPPPDSPAPNKTLKSQ